MSRRRPLTIKVYTIKQNGELIGEGTARELELWFGVDLKTIRKVAKEGTDLDGYQIEFLEERKKSTLEANTTPKKVERIIPKEEDDLLKDKLKYLVWHLKTYGNTSVSFDPVPYFPKLYDLGFDCRCREVTDATFKKEVTSNHRRKKPAVHYYVEVA